jgi:hypothetical protein
MDVKDRRPCPGGSGTLRVPGTAGLEGLLDALPPASVVRRRPVVRLARGRREATVAAERLAVSRTRLAAALGSALGEDEDLLRHAADRIAARLPAAVLRSGTAGSPAEGIPARLPVLLPLPLRPLPPPVPRPGLIGVLPLAAAAAACGRSLVEHRAAVAALGWRLAIGGVDAAALRFAALAAFPADLLLLRWSPALAGQRGALRDADPQGVVLAGCEGAEALEWGRSLGLVLFSGSAAEAMLPSAPRPVEASP